MHRNSARDMAFRTVHTLARGTVNKSDDDRLMQELHVDFMYGEGRTRIESPQNYGFTSTNLPRDEKKQQQGGADPKADDKGPASEVIVAFVGGQRNHPVILGGADDRRHRPRGLKPGENAQYDDIGQMTLMRRTGNYQLSLDSKDENGKMVERMTSMRHVEKKKQEQPKQEADAQGKAKQTEQPEHKHEGESVNTEVRCTKSRISFFAGETEVAFYDVAAKRWCFVGEIKLGSTDADQPVYGVNSGVGMTTNPTGDGAVLIKAPKPGPPTSQDAQP